MMTSELWMYSRLCGLQNALDQSDFEQAELDFPDLSQFAKNGKAAVNQRDWAHVHALIERRKAGHLRTWNTFSRGLERMKKAHPMVDPGVLDFQADLAALAEEPEPPEPSSPEPPPPLQPVTSEPLTSPARPAPPLKNEKPVPGLPQPRPTPRAAKTRKQEENPPWGNGRTRGR